MQNNNSNNIPSAYPVADPNMQSAVPMAVPMQGVPMAAPMQGVPMAAPMQGVPMGAPMQGVPMAAPMQGVPMGAPVQGVPVQGVPMGAPMQGVPMGAPMGAPMQGVPMQAIPNQGQVGQGYDAFQALMNLNGVIVKQKAQYLESLTGFEQANKYLIYPLTPDGKVTDFMQPIFLAVEDSECCQRQMCGSAREFTMYIKTSTGQDILMMHRPFKCQLCACCNLPELSSYFPNNTEVPIGKICADFDCCDDKFTIYDHNEMPIMSVHGDCCQMGKFCHFPCEGFDTIHYSILNTASGQEGAVDKKFSSFTRELLSDADNFIVVFPPNSTLNERVLVLSSTFLIDFMYFEKDSDDKQDNNFSIN